MRLTMRIISAMMNTIETAIEEVIHKLRDTPYRTKLEESRKAIRVSHRAFKDALGAMVDNSYGD